MSRTSLLIFLGVLIAIVPFSGVPIAARSLIELVCGICVLGIGFSLRAGAARRARRAAAEASTASSESAAPHGISPI